MKKSLENYIAAKKNLYSKIEENYSNHPKISVPIKLNSEIFEKLRVDFSDYLAKRDRKDKFKQKEITAFKEDLVRLNPTFELVRNSMKPSVYWFTISSDDIKIREDIVKKLNIYKKDSDRWVTQALEKKTGTSTTTLYVGKVQYGGTLFNRFIQHLGLGHKYTSSIHLLGWFKGIPVDINYYFLEIEEPFYSLVDDIECVVAHLKKPLLGEVPKYTI